MSRLLKNWYDSISTTASSTSTYTASSRLRYEDYAIQADKQFEKTIFKDFELTIEKHREKKKKEANAKKEYMFDPDNLDI